MIKFVPRAIIQYLIYACALLYKRELRKAVHQYNFPHCILRTETKASSAKDQRMYYMVTKYFHAPLNYQMNLRVYFYFCCCVCGHLGRIYDLCFGQKCWKSYYSRNKNKLFSCEIIRSIQQATSISFFFFVGNQSRNTKKTNFALSGNRSEHRFHVRSRVPL